MRIILPALLASLSLVSCGKKAPPPAPQQAEQRQAPRPSAALGLFVSYFMSKGVYPPVGSAVQGVDAQMRFLQQLNPLENEDTFTLLQEFGNVLQVDVPDLLNRSPDRPQTLTAYTEGLRNITERSRRMVQELDGRSAELRTQERDARGQVSALQRGVNEAYRAQDYSTAGGLQEQLGEAQARISQVTGDAKQVRDVQDMYERLIKVADERLQVMEENREVLIAGMRVVELPGIDDLGILETGTTRRQQNTGTPLLRGLEDL